MSYSFYVECPRAPTYESVLRSFAFELDTDEGFADELEGPWEEGHILAVWQHGVSTRPIELAWQERKFSARILACSCGEDYDLALDAVCFVAEDMGAEVESEEGVRFTPATVDEHYGPEWIDEHVDSMVSYIVRHDEYQGTEHSTMPGTTADFHVGRRVTAELRAAEDPAALLFDKMRARFYPDEERYYRANVLAVTKDDGTELTATALMPGVGYVFPPVQYFTVLADPPFEMPFEALEMALGADAITWMDEVSPRIEAIGPDAWPAFEAEARKHATDMLGIGGGDGGAPERKPEPGSTELEPAGIPTALIVGLAIAVIVVLYLVFR